MRTRLAFLGTIAIAVACGATAEYEPLTASVAGAPADVRAACELAAVRCSHCHTLERVLDAPATDPSYWRTYVRRMRLTPGSGIRPDEEPTILHCLIYRSFGPEAVSSR
ncbi:MAG TPA: photosystem P840 reaction-center cytochrome c-551 [Kofleriaceae bacterium]|nr:photosystem P840 reaction-center cytochrome c-551 [Kofleriaceae bacterium]